MSLHVPHKAGEWTLEKTPGIFIVKAILATLFCFAKMCVIAGVKTNLKVHGTRSSSSCT